MGTGESAGEKRALAAAEAAIANPLIDDSSMKGARGLLISITGGNDLTLFEVDEAATRIREEVDQDANIIVGATFDEGLEGVIRVSVVATGIEQAATARANAPAIQAVTTPSADSRLADLTARLRADTQRIVERAQRPEPVQGAPATAPRATADLIDRAALAAIAEAVSPAEKASPAPIQPASYGDVSVRPIPPKPSLFPDREEPMGLHEPAPPAAYIPPAAERVPVRAPRMPNFDELPVPAQNEIRKARGEAVEEHPQKARTSLLQRLASVGLGRRDDADSAPPRAAEPAMPPMPPLPERKPQRPIPAQHGGDPVSEYARRPAPQGLDSHGRSAPVAAPSGDDHLDIPAFLRRQAT